jgi:hypothetical protein
VVLQVVVIVMQNLGLIEQMMLDQEIFVEKDGQILAGLVQYQVVHLNHSI